MNDREKRHDELLDEASAARHALVAAKVEYAEKFDGDLRAINAATEKLKSIYREIIALLSDK